MRAYYYKITDIENPSYVIDEGIIKDSEDTIYPAQVAGESEAEEFGLPYECECHHFTSSNGKSKIEGFYFDIPIEGIMKYKVLLYYSSTF